MQDLIKDNSIPTNLTDWIKKFNGVDESFSKLVTEVQNGSKTFDDLEKYMNTTSTSGSKLASTFKTFGANLAINLGITAVITLISKLATSYSEMVDKAQEATSKFQEQSSSIESNKQSITELRTALESGNLSYSEAASKREELIAIQRELLSSYGSEAEGIDLVNGSLEEQIALLDELDAKNRQEWKNSVNELSNASEIWNWWTSSSKTLVNQTVNPFSNLERTGKLLGNLIDGESLKDSYKEYLGYADTATELFGTNLDQISDKVENFEAKFDATDNGYLNRLLESFNGISFDWEKKEFIIDGNVEDVSNTITTIQTQLKDIPGYTDEIDNQLTTIYNDAQKIATESLETYKTAIQNEILDDNSADGLKQYYMSLSEAYQEYQNALVEDDDSAIEKAKASFSDTMDSILSSGINEKYINYFLGLYPDLKSVVDDWNFEAKITPNLDDFKNNSLLKDFSTDEIFEQFKEGGNNLSETQKTELANLSQMADECGMSLDDFLAKLEEANVAQSQLEKDFLKKIDFTGRSNADPVKQYLSSLTDEDYTLLLDAEIPISSKTWLEKDWENFIEQLKFITGELTIDFDPETAFDAMTTALSEQKEQGYLTDETLQSLKSTYGDLTDILTYSENGVVLNTDAMVDLTNQTAEAALVSTRMKESLAVKDYQKAAKQLNSYKQEHVGLEDALNGSTSELNDFLSSLDETERVNIQNTINQMQTLSDTINEYDALEAKIRATTSALNDYVRATSTANNADNFDTARGGLEDAQKLYKNGWTGKDDYKTYIDYIGKYNEEMNKYQSPEDYFKRAERYLTEDISGIYNFLNDAAALDKGWVTNINGQYDIAIDNLNKFAEDMDMSLSFVTDMLLATSEAWDFDVDFSSLSEGLVDGLNAIDPASENARTNLEEFRKAIEALDEAGYDTTDLWNQFDAVESEFNKDIQFTLSISDMSEDELLQEAENVANDVAKAIGIEEIKFDLDESSTDTLIDKVTEYRSGLKEGTDEYNNAQLVIAQLIQQKQELEKPAVMSVDTSGMSDEMSGAIALVQQWVDTSNELERTQALGLDTTQAQAQLDFLTTKLSSVSSTTLANLGLNISADSSIEEVKSQIASIDANTLAKDTNVNITADTTQAKQELNRFKAIADSTVGTVKINGRLSDTFTTDIQNAINNHTYNVKVNATVKGGTSDVSGSAHSYAKGSAYAKGKGKWTVGVKDDAALVGEEGYEIRVRDGMYEVIGKDGAEFTDTKPDDIIFNHQQSKELLKYGHISSRGKSFIKGSAYENGSTERVTGSGGSGWNNSSSSTSSSNKSSSKKKDSKTTKTLIDWIERRINVLTTKAQRWADIIENATNPKRLDSYYKKLEENYKKQVKTYSNGATRYLQKANSIKLSSDLKNKVKSKDSSIFNKDGSMKSYSKLIKEYGEKTAKKIQDYENWYVICHIA